MEREELKKRIVRDLNSEEYPFVVEVRGNTVIGRWKVHEVPQDVDEKKLRLFSVKYKLRKDKTFCGGEMTAHRYDYTPPTSTQTKTVYSVSASDNLPWRKKVALKEFPNIGYDAQKLYSIIEHYLMGNGFFYRPGVWNHAYIDWNAGYKLRLVGVLFIIVGSFVFTGCMKTGILFFQLFPLIHVIIGIWVLLIGLGKVEFYDLRRDIAIKVIFGIIIGGWLVIFALMLLEYKGGFIMATVTMTLNPGDQPTNEQLEEIKAASQKPIKFTDDAPELTNDELAEFKPANPKYYRPTKELISLRLDTVLVDAFKSTGKGYQTKINEALWKGAREMGIISKN